MVGIVVGITVSTIVEQVAVVVPCVGHAVYAGESVRGIVHIVGGERHTADQRFLREPISNSIVGVVIVIASRVVGFGEAIERAIGVGVCAVIQEIPIIIPVYGTLFTEVSLLPTALSVCLLRYRACKFKKFTCTTQ